MQVFNAMCTHMCVPFGHLNSVVASSIIGGGGADIHIFVFCVINFFRNPLFLWSVSTNI